MDFPRQDTLVISNFTESSALAEANSRSHYLVSGPYPPSRAPPSHFLMPCDNGIRPSETNDEIHIRRLGKDYNSLFQRNILNAPYNAWVTWSAAGLTIIGDTHLRSIKRNVVCFPSSVIRPPCSEITH
jgi:hypothetical protein